MLGPLSFLLLTKEQVGRVGRMVTARFLVSYQRTSGVHVNPFLEPSEGSFFVMWRLWCKALGEKSSPNNREADVVAAIRTVVLLGYMVTNCFIVAGVIRHWDSNSTVPLHSHHN